MTNQEILEKAINKAIAGGWNTTHFSTFKGQSYKHPDESEFHDLTGSWHSISPADIIFNHDFAKALWGERTHTVTGPWLNDYKATPGWRFYLQQMVIADDPIKYLGENI